MQIPIFEMHSYLSKNEIKRSPERQTQGKLQLRKHDKIKQERQQQQQQ